MLPEAVFHACRHLDETEGPVRAGRVLQSADRAAINCVLRYLAELNRQDAEQRAQPRVRAVTHEEPGLPPQRKLTRAEVDAWLEEHDDPSLRAQHHTSPAVAAKLRGYYAEQLARMRRLLGE